LRHKSADNSKRSPRPLESSRSGTHVIARPNGAKDRLGSAYRTHVSFDLHDPSWEEFLWNHGGHYKQSGAWADVKGAFDWKVARLTVTHHEEIVGGGQVLLRKLPFRGGIAFAPEAPVLAGPENEILELVLDGLHRLAQQCQASILMVHPPRDDQTVLAALASRGYRPTPLEMAASATSVVDLRRDEEAIFATMRKKTRQHIRKGIREGVTVVEGDEDDLGTVYRLHVATAERKGLSPVYPERYFVKLWKAFRPTGSARIFLAKCQGDVLSALFVVAFGDTAYTMAVTWSGHHSDRRPNELLHWSALRWAKQNDYSFWDFSSIDSSAAAAVLDGRSLPDDVQQSTTFFKLGFGGDVVLFPSTYERVFNPFLRSAYRAIVPRLFRSRTLQRQVYRLRWRGLSSLGWLRLKPKPPP
jgi:peptidoglycan pentaglycine glycine transferase (the first glycine)